MDLKSFDQGFAHELQNRAFALRSMSGVARRLRGDGRTDLPFWEGYAELERFNVPRYAEAARRWNLSMQPSPWTKARAALVGSTPKFLLRRLLEFAHPKTVEYLEDLRRLRDAGPSDGRDFLEYMVQQEAVQIQMMKLALERRYSEIPTELDAFFLAHQERNLFG
ncbi:hypothetical protein ACFTWS_39945 [Streptomyces sp. NPDC057027]|uniref:hypothetical protein n=1 Tax=Streptomyces sp. NPDC057027 TaxID=3346004 RepID=UPI003633E801